jgi:tRNA(fMet)-specific endonuclease VapC
VNRILDTNIVSALLTASRSSVRERFKRAKLEGELFIPSIVVHELWYGVLRSARQRENGQGLAAFLRGEVSLIAFDEEDALRAAELRVNLEGGGQPIGAYDLLIAAQALRSGATLVSGNVREFGRIKELKLENWLLEV